MPSRNAGSMWFLPIALKMQTLEPDVPACRNMPAIGAAVPKPIFLVAVLGFKSLIHSHVRVPV